MLLDITDDPESGQGIHEQPGGVNLSTLIDLLTALEPELDALEPLAGLFGRELARTLIENLPDRR